MRERIQPVTSIERSHAGLTHERTPTRAGAPAVALERQRAAGNRAASQTLARVMKDGGPPHSPPKPATQADRAQVDREPVRTPALPTGRATRLRGLAEPMLTTQAVIALQRSAGNHAVTRVLQREPAGSQPGENPMDVAGQSAEEHQRPDTGWSDAPPQADEAPQAEQEQEPDEPTGEPQPQLEPVPIGGGHHVTARVIGGELRVGIESEFTEVEHIVKLLLSASSPLNNATKATVTAMGVAVEKLQDTANEASSELAAARSREFELRATVTELREPLLGGPQQRFVNTKHPRYNDYEKARDASDKAVQTHREALARAVSGAKDTILELWEIGKDFLPEHLMPVGEVFRDKANFLGDRNKFEYHTGAADDPIPIRWYKAVEDYPRLRLADKKTVLSFGDSFKAAGITFGLNADNRPKPGWKIQKKSHHESREGQKLYNKALKRARIQVDRDGNGHWVWPPVGEGNPFDGDHVKDLGFGGADSPQNYWPLPSRINRRAFTGYNAGYVVHYKEANGEHKSRAIGGLVGKWFEVKSFLGSLDGPAPSDGPAAGGTPKKTTKKPSTKLKKPSTTLKKSSSTLKKPSKYSHSKNSKIKKK